MMGGAGRRLREILKIDPAAQGYRFAARLLG
jgi:hypothetical protein